MQYFKKHNLAFFHIPKTGGTSFRKFLKRYLGEWEWIGRVTNHEPLFIKKDVMSSELFNSINIVTIIRNPIAAVVSYYTPLYSTSLSKGGKLRSHVIKKFPHLEEIYGLSFNEFVDWYINSDMIYSYDEYLLVDGEIPDNVHIIKLETLKEDVNKILNEELKLNVNVNTIPRSNKSTVKKPTIDQPSLDKIIERYAWVFDNDFYRRHI